MKRREMKTRAVAPLAQLPIWWKLSTGKPVKRYPIRKMSGDFTGKKVQL